VTLHIAAPQIEIGDTMILSSKTKRVLEVALANRAAKNEVLDALGSHAVAKAALATTASPTQWSDLQVGDIVIRLKAGTTGTAPFFDVVVAAGVLPANVLVTGAAVVGDLHIVLRPQ
jgi:hypothetical protein